MLLCVVCGLGCDPTLPPPNNIPPPADHHLEVWSSAKLQWHEDLTNATFPSQAFGVNTARLVAAEGGDRPNPVRDGQRLRGQPGVHPVIDLLRQEDLPDHRARHL